MSKTLGYTLLLALSLSIQSTLAEQIRPLGVEANSGQIEQMNMSAQEINIGGSTYQLSRDITITGLPGKDRSEQLKALKAGMRVSFDKDAANSGVIRVLKVLPD